MKWVLIALATSVLAVGGWTANRAAMSVTTIEFREHVNNADRKFDKIQEELREQRNRVEDKLDKIQEYLIRDHE